MHHVRNIQDVDIHIHYVLTTVPVMNIQNLQHVQNIQDVVHCTGKKICTGYSERTTCILYRNQNMYRIFRTYKVYTVQCTGSKHVQNEKGQE